MMLFLFFVSSRFYGRHSKILRPSSSKSSFKQIQHKYIESFLDKNNIFNDEGMAQKNRKKKGKLLKESNFATQNQISNDNHKQLFETSSPQSSNITTENETFIDSPSSIENQTEISLSVTPTPLLLIPTATPSPTSFPASSASPILTSITPSASSSTSLSSSAIIPLPTPKVTSSAIPASSPMITKTQNQIDEDEYEERKQRNFLIALCAAFFFLLIVVLSMYIYCRRKEEEQNPEYTRAILGDDAFEFSQLQTL